MGRARLWGEWVAASVLGLAFGAAVIARLGAGGLFLLAIVPWGLCLGMAQATVLWRLIGPRAAMGWIALCTGGALLGLACGVVGAVVVGVVDVVAQGVMQASPLLAAVAVNVPYALAGLCVGGLQLLVLARHLRHPRWWPAANLLAAPLYWSWVGLPFASFMLPPDVGGVALRGVVGGLLYGVVTATVLAWQWVALQPVVPQPAAPAPA